MKDFAGVAEFMTAFDKLKNDIEACKGTSDQMYAGFILNAAEDLYPTTREYLVNLPPEEQTKEIFHAKYLQAEKLQQQRDNAEASMVGRSGSAAHSLSSKVCHYVRQRDGKFWSSGHQCTGRHAPSDCLAKKDDDWLKKHPDATADDLPNWPRSDGSRRRQQAPDKSGRRQNYSRHSKPAGAMQAIDDEDDLDFGPVYSDDECADEVAGCTTDLSSTMFFSC
jgi:hypothetical protein